MAAIPYIKTDSISTDFENHLNDQYNERILFSSGFGAGKSTFLKSFFESHPKYLVLKLYPINYSVAQNQDVFELIKYDLLYEILNNFSEDISLNQEQFSTLLLGQMFLLHRMKIDIPLKILMKAASLVSGTELISDKAVDSVIDTVNSFSDFKKETNANEYAILNEYIKSFKDKPGHAHESDAITELIVNLLERVKKSKEQTDPELKYQTILLIDDLDRLDPEHVFRLFNVFSAHHDDVTETNKFGFDKIIFVCDANNIQQMFHHRYGLNVEFCGYIDKYYSTEIFRFDFINYLKGSVEQLISAKDEMLRFFPEGTIDKSFVDRYNLKKQDGFFKLMQYVLFDLIDEHLIRIRNFQRFKYYALPKEKIKTPIGGEMPIVYYPFLVLMIHIQRFFPRPIDVENGLQKLYSNYKSNYEPISLEGKEIIDDTGDMLIQQALQFLVEDHHAFGMRGDRDKEYALNFQSENGKQLFISYSVFENMQFSYTQIRYKRCMLTDERNEQGFQGAALRRPNPYWFIYHAYKNCREKRFL